MHEFRVWAPEARTVDVVIDGAPTPMEAGPDGWWSVVAADAGAGTRYAFSVDGGPPRPDPRSRSQPDGVHGSSEVVVEPPPARIPAWRGASWRGTILYELHVGTFTPEGTFDSAIERLDHIADLGVTAVELMPVVEFSGSRGWGYDGVDLFAPHHAYGGPDGLRRLIDACHARGLGVVMDVVYNHLGPAGNYLPEFGPYFSDQHQTTWGEAVNYDGADSGEVRRFVIDNALMWFRDFDVDGLRLDAVHAIIDDSAVHLMEELSIEVDAIASTLNRPLFLVAENDRNDPRLVRSRDAGGWGLDSAWADDWHHAVHALFTGERSGYYADFGSMEILAKALRQAWVYDGSWSPSRGRRHGAPTDGLSGNQFVICTQNHDQIGNRALGERSTALMSPGRLRIAAALMLTSPFVPLLFQGEEWAASTPFQYFTDHQDPELGRAVAEGRRSEFSAFGWDPDEVPNPQDARTFERSKLKWDEVRDAPHAQMLDWYRDLIALRRSIPALSDPRLDSISVDHGESWLVVHRGPVRVLVNIGEQPHRFEIADAHLLMTSADDVRRDDASVVVPPDGVAIATTDRNAP